MQLDVKHNEEERRFEAEIDGMMAVADYRRSGSRITFTHTEVPSAHRGHGFGAQLARAALDYARAEQLDVVPQCPFIDAFMRKHPEYEDLRAD